MPLQILIADDHGVVRKGLRILLESNRNWNICAEASNGREAVEEAVKFRPDIAILDISMPDLNGVEAARQIRQRCPGTFSACTNPMSSYAKASRPARRATYCRPFLVDLRRRSHKPGLLRNIEELATGSRKSRQRLAIAHKQFVSSRKEMSQRLAKAS